MLTFDGKLKGGRRREEEAKMNLEIFRGREKDEIEKKMKKLDFNISERKAT